MISPTPIITTPTPHPALDTSATNNPMPAPITRIKKKKNFRISTS